MIRRIALLLMVLGAPVAIAQQQRPTEPPPASAEVGQASPQSVGPQAQTPPTLRQNIPEASPADAQRNRSESSGPSAVSALIAASGAIVALISLGGTAWVFRRQASLQRELAAEAREHAAYLQRDLAEAAQDHALKLASRSARLQENLAEAARKHTTDEGTKDRESKLAIDQQKLDLEYEKLLKDADASSLQDKAATLRLVHDKRTEEARLIHLFFDKLVAQRQSERDLALLALSATVDHALIERLQEKLPEIVVDLVGYTEEGPYALPTNSTPGETDSENAMSLLTAEEGPQSTKAQPGQKIVGYTTGPYAFPIYGPQSALDPTGPGNVDRS